MSNADTRQNTCQTCILVKGFHHETNFNNIKTIFPESCRGAPVTRSANFESRYKEWIIQFQSENDAKKYIEQRTIKLQAGEGILEVDPCNVPCDIPEEWLQEPLTAGPQPPPYSAIYPSAASLGKSSGGGDPSYQYHGPFGGPHHMYPNLQHPYPGQYYQQPGMQWPPFNPDLFGKQNLSQDQGENIPQQPYWGWPYPGYHPQLDPYGYPYPFVPQQQVPQNPPQQVPQSPPQQVQQDPQQEVPQDEPQPREEQNVNTGLRSDTEETQQDKFKQYRKMGNTEDFKKLLKIGTFRLYNNCVYLCGACNVGKSTFASVLLDIDIPIVWFSTNGLRIFYGRNGIDLINKIMVPLKEGAAGHDVLGNVLRGEPTIEKPATSEPETTTRTNLNIQTTTATKAQANLEKTEKEENIFSTIISPAQVKTSSHHKTEEQPSRSPKWSEKEKLDLQKLKVHDSILEEIRSGKYEMKIAPSDLVDFGGQRSFDMTHQLFIRQRGSFVVMINGQHDLDDILPEYPKDSKMTSLLIIKHWVESILTYCTLDDDIMPMILFAATHSDVFSPEELAERQNKITKELTDMFSKHPQSGHIMYDSLFFINATDKTDPEIKRMTSKIVEIAMKQRTWGQPVPMAWVPMEMLISQMKSQNVNIITKQVLMEVNQQNDDLALTDQELERFLKAQHSLGKIMYFQQHGLDNFVIIQTSALVNILRAFVTDKLFWPEEMELRQIHETLNDLGKIYKEDLFKLWKQEDFARFIPDDEIRDYMIKILIHLDILIEPKHRKGALEKFYLVPCMVKHVCPTRVSDDPTMEEKAICLSYRLVKSTVPAALSFKMVGAALCIWPFKEEEGRPLLFFKSAVLCVDDANELRIDVEDDRILVCMINAETKQNISPDISASIQESMTWALKNALDFYHTCMGKAINAVEIEDLFEINVGLVCQENLCFLKLNEAEQKSTWTCERNKKHSTKHPRFWVFDKTVEQDQCPVRCTGLTEEELVEKASNKHLVRLAAKIGIYSFRDFIIYLGLTRDEWEEIEYSYRSPDTMSMKFMALHKWRGKKEADHTFGTLKDLLIGLQEIEDNRHHLCQIFRERTELLGVRYTIPNDDVLHELSQNIGDCAVQLGIELGLPVAQVERTIAMSRDVFQQTHNILMKWKGSKTNTLNILMQTLQRVRPEGMTFLKKKYNIEISDVSKRKEQSRPRLQSALPEHSSEKSQSSQTKESENEPEGRKRVSDVIKTESTSKRMKKD